MTIEMRDPQKAKITKADLSLQKRVGTGPLDEKLIEKCQKTMEQNRVDFQPQAIEFLQKLDVAVKAAKGGNLSKAEAVQGMTTPVMQLKANAAMFRYDLVSNLANIMLSFLEAVQDLDDDVLQIVEAHQNTLTAITMKKLQGDGGVPGKQLEDELKAACKRYFKKKT